MEIDPVTLNVLVGELQIPGIAVIALILQRILQLVVALPDVCAKLKFVLVFE